MARKKEMSPEELSEFNMMWEAEKEQFDIFTKQCDAFLAEQKKDREVVSFKLNSGKDGKKTTFSDKAALLASLLELKDTGRTDGLTYPALPTHKQLTPLETRSILDAYDKRLSRMIGKLLIEINEDTKLFPVLLELSEKEIDSLIEMVDTKIQKIREEELVCN